MGAVASLCHPLTQPIANVPSPQPQAKTQSYGEDTTDDDGPPDTPEPAQQQTVSKKRIPTQLTFNPDLVIPTGKPVSVLGGIAAGAAAACYAIGCEIWGPIAAL